MKSDEYQTSDTASHDDGRRRERRPWQAPRIESSEVFTRAALACCLNLFQQPTGSAGANLPDCSEV